MSEARAQLMREITQEIQRTLLVSLALCGLLIWLGHVSWLRLLTSLILVSIWSYRAVSLLTWIKVLTEQYEEAIKRGRYR